MSLEGMEPGKAYDPETAPAPPAIEVLTPDAVEPEVTWEVGQLKRILSGVFTIVDYTAGKTNLASATVEYPGGETERVKLASLQATEDELESMAKPMCRILNRHPVLSGLAGQADAGELALAFFGYTGRVSRDKSINHLQLVRKVGAADTPTPPQGPTL